MSKSLVLVPLMAAIVSCGGPPPSHPALSPQAAEQLLHYNNRAANHLKYIQSQDRTCTYRITLPDQSSHPTSITLTHIAWCSGRNDLKAFDARVEYQWNKSAGKWEIGYFGS